MGRPALGPNAVVVTDSNSITTSLVHTVAAGDAPFVFLHDNDFDGFDATLDCDDNNASAFPGGTEVCDRVDNDCNGLVDDKVLSCSAPCIFDFDCAPPESCFAGVCVPPVF